MHVTESINGSSIKTLQNITNKDVPKTQEISTNKDIVRSDK